MSTRNSVRRMFRRTRRLDDFTAEVESHLQLEIDRLQDEGLTPDEARAAARRAFGSLTASRERFYEAHRWLWWDRLWHDVRYAARMLRRSPGFTSVTVATMALGIGATTAMFSVIDATLLHPLPYPQADQLVSVEDDLPGLGSYDVGLSQPEWLDLERSGIFQQISPAWFDENNLTGSSRPTRVRLSSVAPNYFAVLGVKPQLGRSFPPEDRSPSFTQEVVISDGMWKRGFGGDPNILDRSIRLDTDLYHIVGVMPPGFHPPGRTTEERNLDVWAATSFYGAPMSDHPPRSGRNIPGAIARLAPGLTIAAAQSRVDALVAALRGQYPGDYPAHAAWRVRLVPLKETVYGNVRQSLVLLLGAVGLVLLIGCVNVANLLLARAGARSRELAVRQALGAGRGRLVRQLLTESICVSLLGGAAAMGILFASERYLVRLVPDGLPRLSDIAINWKVLLFALLATAISGAIFGLVPALHAGRVEVTSALKSDARGSTASGERTRTRRLLVVAEFALSLVLMVAAGLLLRSFWDLLKAPLGFNPQGVLTLRTRLPYPNDVSIDKYRTVASEAPFLREVLRRSERLPGVEEAALGSSSAIPLDHPQQDTNTVPMLIEGRGTDAAQAPLVEGAVVTPGYFHLLGRTLVRGRLLTDFDNETAPPVAVINDAMARAFWPNTNPLGQHVKLSRSATSWTTVVGIVADARTESLKDAHVPAIYASAYQGTTKHLAIFLRGRVDAAATADQVREQVQLVDATLPVFGAQMLEDTVAASLAERRFSMQLVGLFAVTALLLAGLGIYGVISYIVSERTREIGIRLALGAERRTIVGMVLGQSMPPIVAGAAIGIACALGVARLMAGLLYGVRPTDPATFSAVPVVLVVVALFACYIPARRATRIDPMIALRDQ
ncbi:MAG TPA: ABC transporter permease [Vicinamibacterales bacterium]|nr:ABC transporter permease [Vicinamibacterales bacterium]